MDDVSCGEVSGHDAYDRAPRRLPRASGGLSRRQLLGLSRTKLGVGRVDYPRLTARLAQAWDGEARTLLLRALEPVADTVAGMAVVGAATRVLDVGAGDGNVALELGERLGGLGLLLDRHVRQIEPSGGVT